MSEEDNQNWKELALKAKNKLAEADAFIKQIMSPPFVYGTVIRLNNDSADVDINGRIMEVHYNPQIKDQLTPGIPVRMNPDTHAIISTRGRIETGVLTTIEEILEDGSGIINQGGKKQVIKSSSKLNEGDRVIIDSGVHTVLKNLGKKSIQYHVAEMPIVPWEKIGGLEEEIKSVKEAIEEPFVHKEIYARYNKKAPKGVLLYGPPGCGKTLMAKAIAYNLTARLKENGNTDGNGYFLSIRGPELLDKYVGESERAIRALFNTARENSKQSGDVTVVFMDEAESLLKKRGTDVSTGIYDSIVPQFLAEMDGMTENENVVLILATNRADIIDPAVLRPGRIDKKIRVKRPNKEAVKEIFKIHLEGMPIYSDGNICENRESLAEYASNSLFGENYPLFRATFQEGNFAYVNMSHLVSGAMIESISQGAARNAIKREVKNKIRGITKEDLVNSINEEYSQLKNLVTCEIDDLKAIFPMRYHSISDLGRVSGRENNGY